MAVATKFRSLDVNNDWTFGLGLQGYAPDLKGLMFDLQTKLRCWIGDCFFDMQMGIDWKNLLGDLGSKDSLLLSARTRILKTPGVLRINSLEIINDENIRDLSLTYNIDTVYESGVDSDFSLFSSNNNVMSVYTTTTYIPIDASAGPVTKSVPSAIGKQGTELVYKKTDSSENAITLVPSLGETFDGQSSYQLTSQYEDVRLISNNTNWWISGKL